MHGCIPIPNPRHCEDVDGRVDLQLWQANKGSFGTREATCSCLPGYWPDASMHNKTSSLFTQAGMQSKPGLGEATGQGKCVQGNFNKGLVFISSMHMHAHICHINQQHARKKNMQHLHISSKKKHLHIFVILI